MLALLLTICLGLGHANAVDAAVLGDDVRGVAEPLADTRVEGEVGMSFDQRYIHIPAAKRSDLLELAVSVGKHDLGVYRLHLGRNPCDFAYIDLGSLAGKGLDVHLEEVAGTLDGVSVDAQPRPGVRRPMVCRAAVEAFRPDGIKMMHTPSEGKMWDPSILWHDGWYYLFAMHNAGEGDYGMWGARSRDGVHWEDLGPVIADAPFKVWKMFVMHNGEYFIAAHGSFSGKPGHENDTQRHWRSRDGVAWEYLGDTYDTHPDPRWYQIERRWDCMYMIPSESGHGWVGYTVATLPDGNGALGKLESDDGMRWTVLPPIHFDWQGIKAGFAEFVGVEKIGDRYYTICGKQIEEYGCPLYSVYTYVSDSPDGPFVPDREAFRLCGGTGAVTPPQWLATFGRGRDGELLISNYVGTKGWGPDVTLLPLKRAAVDAEGHLRPSYWSNNDAAKGEAVAVDEGLHIKAAEGRTMHRLDQRFDLQRGVILEGVLQATAVRGGEAFAGFYLGHRQSGRGGGILLGIGEPGARQSYIGLLREFGEVSAFDAVDYIAGPAAWREAGLGVANVTGIADGNPHPFRLWIRQGLLELYVDDVAVQTFFTGDTSGVIGLLAENAHLVVTGLKCWQMNLD